MRRGGGMSNFRDQVPLRSNMERPCILQNSGQKPKVVPKRGLRRFTSKWPMRLWRRLRGWNRVQNDQGPRNDQFPNGKGPFLSFLKNGKPQPPDVGCYGFLDLPSVRC